MAHRASIVQGQGWLAAVVVSLTLGVLGGCVSDGTRVAIAGVENVKEWQPCALDIENYSGEIEVRVEPGLAEPVIRCEKLVPGVAPSTTISTQAAAVTSAIVEDSAGRHVLKIRTLPESEHPAEAVFLSIRTPSCDGLRVRNAGGQVRAYGVAGAIDIENLPGVAGLTPDIAVRTDRAISAPIRINSSDGYIQLSMSSESAGRLNLEGIGGRVEVQAERGRLEGVRTDGTTFTGVLNRGEHEVKIQSLRGDILVRLTRPIPAAASPAPQATAGDPSPSQPEASGEAAAGQ